MKYNEYYSSNMLGRIGITFRGEEKEIPPDENEQIILYVDVYTLRPFQFLDITNKYATMQKDGNSPSVSFNSRRIETIGKYKYNEDQFWNTAYALGVAREPPAGGRYFISHGATDTSPFVPESQIPSLVTSNPEITDSMKVVTKYFEEYDQKDLMGTCELFFNATSYYNNIFGLKNQNLYSIVNADVWNPSSSSPSVGIRPPDNARLIPRFEYFKIKVGGSSYMNWMNYLNYTWDFTAGAGEVAKGYNRDSGVRARCINGVVTFDTDQPNLYTNFNFPYNLESFTIDNTITAEMLMWFKITARRSISCVCTRKEADKWIEDVNKWIDSKNLHKGMIQIYIDPHIMDIPDWYAQKIGL